MYVHVFHIFFTETKEPSPEKISTKDDTSISSAEMIHHGSCSCSYKFSISDLQLCGLLQELIERLVGQGYQG